MNSLPPLEKPALLMIDFQKDFCSPGGYADQHGGGEASTSSQDNLSWVHEIIPDAYRLLEAARGCNTNNAIEAVPIIHTREGYAPDLSDCNALKLERSRRGGCEIGSQGPLGRLLIRGEEGHDIIPKLYPLPNEIVLDKAGYCAFRDTNLHALLQQHGVKELMFAGVTADVCVHTTLRSAIELGCYRCYYVKDAISTFEADIRAACERMVSIEGGIWGQVVTVKEIEELLKGYQKKKHAP